MRQMVVDAWVVEGRDGSEWRMVRSLALGRLLCAAIVSICGSACNVQV